MSKLDDLLYKSLAPSEEPSEDLNRQIARRTCMNMSTTIRRRFATVAAVGFCLMAGGTGAYAVGHYLFPSEVASQVSETNALAKAFESESAITVNETQKTGDYEVCLLGMVSGTDLEPCVSGDEAAINKERSYAAIAIARADGKPVGEDRKTVSPLINGIDWKDVTLADIDATLYSFSKDGVLYELLECDSLEKFAKRGVQLGVVDSFGDEADAFVMDKASGVYKKAAGYTGTNALFSLPLDESKGDEAAVSAYLEALRAAREHAGDESSVENTEGLAPEVVAFSDKISEMSAEDAAAYIAAHCRKADSVKLPYTADGTLSWDEEDISGSSGSMDISGYEEGVPAYSGMDSDGTPEGTHYMVITINKDQTATMEIYSLK